MIQVDLQNVTSFLPLPYEAALSPRLRIAHDRLQTGSGAGGGEVAFHAADGALVLEHGLGFQCVELAAEGAAGQRTAREGESKGEKDKGETDGAGHGEPPFGVGV